MVSRSVLAVGTSRLFRGEERHKLRWCIIFHENYSNIKSQAEIFFLANTVYFDVKYPKVILPIELSNMAFNLILSVTTNVHELLVKTYY